MPYPGQPFQKGYKRKTPYQSGLSKPRDSRSWRALCVTRARFATEADAQDTLAKMERTKVNPGALGIFKCKSCDGYHLGTAFGESPRTAERPQKRRRRRTTLGKRNV